MTHHNTEMQSCIQQCLDCYRSCTEAITGHCLEQGGDHVAPQHVRLMLDCADICQTSAAFMMRGSARHQQTCALCADICNQCAEECERLGDAHMRQCADVCRTCATSCQAMSGMTAR